MLDALGNIGDFVGGMGVIVTLAYLAIQIRHNTRVARASTLQQWVSMAATVNNAVFQSGDFSRIYRVGCEDPGSLEPHERTQFNQYLFQMFNTYESLFFQAEQGAIDQAFLNAKMESMHAGLETPGMRHWWDRFSAINLDARFREFVNQRLLR